MAAPAAPAVAATSSLKKMPPLEEIFFDDTAGSYLGCVGDNTSSECDQSEFLADDAYDDATFNNVAAESYTREVASPLPNRRPLSSAAVTPSAAHRADTPIAAATSSRPVIVQARAGVILAPGATEWRHRVYDHRVMPADCYFFIVPPPVELLPPEYYPEDPVTEVAQADLVGDALAASEPDYWDISATATPAAKAALPPALPVDDAMAAMDYGAAAAVAPLRRPRPAGPRPGAAAGVMCCYWKQGSCSMGATCWYSHEGTPDTPCHYGATCRKGHRELVRSNPQAPPRDSRVADAAPAAAAAVAHPVHAPAAAVAAPAAGAVPRRYVHEPRSQRPSAPLVQTDMPCPHCTHEGEVWTQEFPVFDGDRMRHALRAHCRNCLRTFMIG